jgi:hypothetical protein
MIKSKFIAFTTFIVWNDLNGTDRYSNLVEIEFKKAKEKVKDKNNRKEMEYMKKDDAINFFLNLEYKI